MLVPCQVRSSPVLHIWNDVLMGLSFGRRLVSCSKWGRQNLALGLQTAILTNWWWENLVFTAKVYVKFKCHLQEDTTNLRLSPMYWRQAEPGLEDWVNLWTYHRTTPLLPGTYYCNLGYGHWNKTLKSYHCTEIKSIFVHSLCCWGSNLPNTLDFMRQNWSEYLLSW